MGNCGISFRRGKKIGWGCECDRNLSIKVAVPIENLEW